MSATVAKNEVTAAKRTVYVTVLDPSGAPAWRGASLVGRAFVGSTSSLTAAAGTWTNIRVPLVVADDTFTANADTEQFTAADHGLETGDGPAQVSSSTTLPAGLTAATDYWIIKIDEDTFQLATSLANAYAGTAQAITTDGTGTHTLSDTSDTERGLDGEFLYTLTQTETDVTASELLVVTNDKRRAFTASASTDELSLTAHELHTGIAIMLSTDAGTMPTGLTSGGYYFVIRVDADSFKVATSQANAFAGTAITLSTDGSGVLYVEPAVYPGRTSVGMAAAADTAFEQTGEGSYTYGDLIRGIARTMLAKFSKSGNDFTWHDLADSKDSHTGTVTSSGRTAASITDLT